MENNKIILNNKLLTKYRKYFRNNSHSNNELLTYNKNSNLYEQEYNLIQLTFL